MRTFKTISGIRNYFAKQKTLGKTFKFKGKEYAISEIDEIGCEMKYRSKDDLYNITILNKNRNISTKDAHVLFTEVNEE